MGSESVVGAEALAFDLTFFAAAFLVAAFLGAINPTTPRKQDVVTRKFHNWKFEIIIMAGTKEPDLANLRSLSE